MITADSEWTANWLDAVAFGTSTTSQRTRSSIDKHGGIENVLVVVGERGAQLVPLTDDRGAQVVAASQCPFETLR